MKQLTEHFFDPTYRVWVTLIANKTKAQAEAYLNRYYKDAETIEINEGWDACFGRVHNKESGICVGYFLWIRNFDWSVEIQGTVAHELWHLVTWVLTARGLELNSGSDEAFAYYYGYWFRKIWTKLKEVY